MRFKALIVCSAIALAATCAEPRYTPGVVDTKSAMKLCDEWGLSGPEGIWQLTGSDMKILIFRRPQHDMASLPIYDITAVTPPDMSVETGEILGTCTPTAEPHTYIIELFSKRNKQGVLCSKKRFQLKIDSEGRSMTEESQRNKNVRINLLGMFPTLSRILRIYYNPVDKKIRGFRKVYPGIDPDGSLPGQIRML